MLRTNRRHCQDREKWTRISTTNCSDSFAFRQAIVCLNWQLEDQLSSLKMRKPFDMLAKGSFLKNCQGDSSTLVPDTPSARGSG
jgi:hypothetical protein